MLLRARDRQLHRLHADHLPVAALSVEGEQAASVQQDLDRGIGLQAAFEHRVDITRNHAGAV